VEPLCGVHYLFWRPTLVVGCFPFLQSVLSVLETVLSSARNVSDFDLLNFPSSASRSSVAFFLQTDALKFPRMFRSQFPGHPFDAPLKIQRGEDGQDVVTESASQKAQILNSPDNVLGILKSKYMIYEVVVMDRGHSAFSHGETQPRLMFCLRSSEGTIGIPWPTVRWRGKRPVVGYILL